MTATAWLSRCPVPTASGLAYRLGWLGPDFARLPDRLAAHHLDHELPGLFREGGNVPALRARAAGAPSRLLGLTWVDERQSILTRPDGPADLTGLRCALPVPGPDPGSGVMRAMALSGFAGALAAQGRTLDDVELVEVPDAREGAEWQVNGAQPFPWTGIAALRAGTVDAVYVKGAASLASGTRIAVDLDALPDPAHRVNNGTPRPITVHQQTLDERPHLVVRFLVSVLRAAAWASTRRSAVHRLLVAETGADLDQVAAAYRDDFHLGLRPTLDAERLALLDRQRRLLLEHGLLPTDVDLGSWVAPWPLRRAEELVRAHPVPAPSRGRP